MKKLVCIVCPNGCSLEIDEKTLEVSGNKCKRGEAFAKTELVNPMRTVCSFVKTAFEDCPTLPVRVSGEIPKDRIFDVMKEIKKVRLDRRVKRGEIIIEDVLGLGVNVIVTSDRLYETNDKEKQI